MPLRSVLPVEIAIVSTACSLVLAYVQDTVMWDVKYVALSSAKLKMNY